MTTTARDVVTAFAALPPAEQQVVVAEILRLSKTTGDIPEAALHELADELFRSYDAQEATSADG